MNIENKLTGDSSFRFAIMGAGKIASKFCEAVSMIPNSLICAVSSKSESRAQIFAEKNNISSYYDNYEEMLKNEKPDCVYICTTPNSHFELCMLCLDYKIPILCEKAMFLNSKEASTVFSRSKELNVFVMEAMWSRFLPAIKKAKQWLEEGKISKPDFVTMAIGFAVPKDNNGLSRFTDPALGGGAAYDITVYPFEITTYLIDEAITDTQVSVVWGETDVDMSEHVLLRFKDTIASLKMSFRSNLEETMVLNAPNGKIVIPFPHRATEAFLYNSSNELVDSFKDDVTTNGFVYEIKEVIQCIRLGQMESFTAPHQMTLQCATLFDQIMATRP